MIVLFYNVGLGYLEDFIIDVKGKIVLIFRGDFIFYEKVKNVEMVGVKVVIIYNNKESFVFVMLNLLGNKVGIFVVGIKKEDGEIFN